MSSPGSKDSEKNKEIPKVFASRKLVERVWEKLGVSPDDYMSLYWDFPNGKVMAIDHVANHTPIGDIYDIVTKGGNIVSFKIRKLKVKQLAKER